MVEFEVGDGTVTTTEDHEFWNVTDNAWQETQHIDAGDLLLTSDGATVEAGSLLWDTAHVAPAFDLTIDEIHTYHVAAGDESVLVHNNTPCREFELAAFDNAQTPEVSKRWRSVVEGRQSLPTDRAAQLELQPKIPPGDPVWLSLLGFDHSDEEVHSLFDGVQRGEEAARRALNWMSTVKAPQHLGQRDELLELGRELQRQLVVALSDLDTELAMQIRSLPIFLQDEALATDGGATSWSLADLRDLLFANAKPQGEYIWPMYQLEIREVAAASSPLVFAHLAAPVAGLNCNLSAACELWRLGGKVKLSDEALQIDLNTDLWVKQQDSNPCEAPAT